MSGKRSFNKAALKRLAVELRAEIGLGIMDALDPWTLAKEYGVEVFALTEIAAGPAAVEHFTITKPGVFSGALIPRGNGAVILENDSHPLARRRSTMSHELAHVVRGHRFTTSLVNERGCRVADGEQEDEADELAGELLVPFDAARQLARRRASNEAVALQFGVSPDMARWRMNSTGARLIAERQAAAYRRAAGS